MSIHIGGYMINSTVLEVAIGLVFCYAFVALIVSSINEAIASALKLRSKNLLEGIKSLLNDHQLEGLALNLYNHALVNPRAPGTAITAKDIKNKPSYIEPKNFAISLIESIQTTPGNFKQLGEDINAIQDAQLRLLLQGMYTRASGDIDNLQTQLSAWFDAGMDRVSGDYKRQSQLFCFLIALVISVVLNVDSIHLFKTLWEHPAIALQITTLQSNANADGIDQLNQLSEKLMGLPIGWQAPYNVGPTAFAGWLITASAALFGAPFWFDLLQKLVRLRGTGVKPDRSNQAEPLVKSGIASS
ncbi:MAG: hypothetical protein AAB278_07100, partial [Pseudomonadota bacterium]